MAVSTEIEWKYSLTSHVPIEAEISLSVINLKHCLPLIPAMKDQDEFILWIAVEYSR